MVRLRRGQRHTWTLDDFRLVTSLDDYCVHITKHVFFPKADVYNALHDPDNPVEESILHPQVLRRYNMHVRKTYERELKRLLIGYVSLLRPDCNTDEGSEFGNVISCLVDMWASAMFSDDIAVTVFGKQVTFVSKAKIIKSKNVFTKMYDNGKTIRGGTAAMVNGLEDITFTADSKTAFDGVEFDGLFVCIDAKGYSQIWLGPYRLTRFGEMRGCIKCCNVLYENYLETERPAGWPACAVRQRMKACKDIDPGDLLVGLHQDPRDCPCRTSSPLVNTRAQASAPTIPPASPRSLGPQASTAKRPARRRRKGPAEPAAPPPAPVQSASPVAPPPASVQSASPVAPPPASVQSASPVAPPPASVQSSYPVAPPPAPVHGASPVPPPAPVPPIPEEDSAAVRQSSSPLSDIHNESEDEAEGERELEDEDVGEYEIEYEIEYEPVGEDEVEQFEVDGLDDEPLVEPEVDQFEVDEPEDEPGGGPEADQFEVDEPEDEPVGGPEVDQFEIDEPEDEPVGGPEVDQFEVDEPEDEPVGEPEIDEPEFEEPVGGADVDEPEANEPEANERVDEPEVVEPKVDELEMDEPKVDEQEVDEQEVDEQEVDEREVDELDDDEGEPQNKGEPRDATGSPSPYSGHISQAVASAGLSHTVGQPITVDHPVSSPAAAAAANDTDAPAPVSNGARSWSEEDRDELAADKELDTREDDETEGEAWSLYPDPDDEPTPPERPSDYKEPTPPPPQNKRKRAEQPPPKPAAWQPRRIVPRDDGRDEEGAHEGDTPGPSSPKRRRVAFQDPAPPEAPTWRRDDASMGVQPINGDMLPQITSPAVFQDLHRTSFARAAHSPTVWTKPRRYGGVAAGGSAAPAAYSSSSRVEASSRVETSSRAESSSRVEASSRVARVETTFGAEASPRVESGSRIETGPPQDDDVLMDEPQPPISVAHESGPAREEPSPLSPLSDNVEMNGRPAASVGGDAAQDAPGKNTESPSNRSGYVGRFSVNSGDEIDSAREDVEKLFSDEDVIDEEPAANNAENDAEEAVAQAEELQMTRDRRVTFQLPGEELVRGAPHGQASDHGQDTPDVPEGGAAVPCALCQSLAEENAQLRLAAAQVAAQGAKDRDEDRYELHAMMFEADEMLRQLQALRGRIAHYQMRRDRQD